MTLNNTKSNNRGFTLVELLIVIVVIAILAAISLVAYNGIQDRSKTSANAAAASTVAKKAEAYNTIKNSYPANIAGFDIDEAKLDNNVKTANGSATSSSNDTISYKPCTTGGGGAQVSYWSFSEKKTVYIDLGRTAANPPAACN